MTTMPNGELMFHQVTKVEVTKRRELGTHYYKFHDTVRLKIHYRDGMIFDVLLFGVNDHAVEIEQ